MEKFWSIHSGACIPDSEFVDPIDRLSRDFNQPVTLLRVASRLKSVHHQLTYHRRLGAALDQTCDQKFFVSNIKRCNGVRCHEFLLQFECAAAFPSRRLKSDFDRADSIPSRANDFSHLAIIELIY